MLILKKKKSEFPVIAFFYRQTLYAASLAVICAGPFYFGVS